MHSQRFFSFLYVTIFITISASQDDRYESYSLCSPSIFKCGSIHDITYPFWIKGRPQNCSYPYPGFTLDCKDDIPEIKIESKIYHVKKIDYDSQTLTIVDPSIIGKNCPPLLNNSTLDYFSIFDYAPNISNLIVYYNCTYPNPYMPIVSCLTYEYENKYSYYMIHPGPLPNSYYEDCQVSFFPLPDSAESRLGKNLTNFEDVMKDGFNVSWVVDSGKCYDCFGSGGNCTYNQIKPDQPLCYCSGKAYPEAYTCPPPTSRSRKPSVRKKIIIGISAAIGGCLVTCVALYLWYRKKHLTPTSSKLISRAISSDPSSKSELGNCKSLLPTQVFDYKELEEATNNFDPSKELGEGGFGTVYYGKLYDGRSVAVKRLYENFRRMEQFMNEIEILSRLRHRNLVALYGCTSRHSRELLLVYEFVPNGTVADHLHGGRAKAGALTWPIRMNIAIETADALAYLHAVEIIHRDVKTNNILLDKNFGVKVADFGLSRLFPMDRTHVSTAPQGTPGYVDPDYHRCYQLTDKSDVFSFGVVLFELISSMPAVDITRHRHEINLSNMAINKIHNNALHELVDPGLGFESEIAARRSITLVAELAYRCLHDDKEMRPCMEEVLKALQEINSSEYKVDKAEVLDIPSDDVVLLNKATLSSPDSVTDPWISRNTTPNASG